MDDFFFFFFLPCKDTKCMHQILSDFKTGVTEPPLGVKFSLYESDLEVDDGFPASQSYLLLCCIKTHEGPGGR